MLPPWTSFISAQLQVPFDFTNDIVAFPWNPKVSVRRIINHYIRFIKDRFVDKVPIFSLQKDKGVWPAGSDHKGMDLKALSGLLGNVRVQVDGNGGHHLCLRSHWGCCLPCRSPFLRWTCNWKVVQKCCLRHKYVHTKQVHIEQVKIFSLVL